ncbi:hypothetical protein [Hyphomicrobium facile]|uniref:Predicted 5' DNA nuclease, flap endonuclease-1-like, helix-3-turn-helix (H3TH) domain n=1 Tax=Hyphomicrobium facile TaxID=51670 RepID=A0A1I7N1R6_9HYPH|nr:hypothetical protein [Hyphomicrobium facile]SFV28565.1 Predicted 5' DNA nuclease, flap endonuclease-1-like, helix-3-turn-helix (H3TH) domain [Hyphomicrobium facile]
MTYLLLQTFLLLLASYFAGAFVACLVKRVALGSSADLSEDVLAPVQLEVPVRPPVMSPSPPPVRGRVAPRMPQPVVAPRAIDPVQPKIDVLRRPEPRPAPKVLDPSRFLRALIGPDPNEGIPRRAIVELRPSVLKPVTGIYRPKPPEPVAPPELEPPAPEPIAEEAPPSLLPEPEPVTKPERPGGLAARLRDATTAAAAGAVAAAKAAAAASAMMPGAFSRKAVEEEKKEEPVETAAEPAEVAMEDVPLESPILGYSDANVSKAETPAAIAPEYQPEPEPEPERAPEPQPAPAPKIVQPPVAKPIEGGDDFQRIRAIDGDIEQRLKAAGVNYFEDIAGWTQADVKRYGQDLQIPGRIDREQWVEQAQILAKGGETYYSRNRLAALKSSAAAAAPKSTTDNDRGQKAESDSGNPASPPSGQERTDLSGVAAASQGRSVAEMAAAAAAAIAAASASVTRGLKPIEPISPLSKVDPKISIPARITDAIRERNGAAAPAPVAKDDAETDADAAAEESAPPSSEADGSHDDLKRIRGIGVLIEKRLNALGVGTYDQIANWTSGDIDRISRSLEFKGRIERENWVEQARILASGGQTEFSRRVDRGEVDTSRET